MTSFAKVCVDISNNLKNLRLTGKSSSNDKLGSQEKTGTNCGLLNNGEHASSQPNEKQAAENILNFPGKSLNQIMNWTSSSSGSTTTKNHYMYSNTKVSNMRTKSANCSPSLSHRKYPCTDITPERKVINARNFSKNSISESNGNQSSANSYSSKGYQINEFSTLPNMSPQPMMFPMSPSIAKQQFGGTSSYEMSQRQYRIYNSSNNSTNSSSNYLNSSAKSYLPPFSPTLSHRVMALAQRVQADSVPRYRSYSNSACNSPNLSQRGVTVAAIKQRLFNQGLKIDLGGVPPLRPSTRYRDYMRRHFHSKQCNIKNLWKQEKLLRMLFKYLDGKDLLSCNLVCKNWFDILSKLRYFDRVYLKLDFKKEFATSLAPTTDSVIEKRVLSILLAGIKRNLHCIKLDHLTDSYLRNFLNSLKACNLETGDTLKPVSMSTNKPQEDKVGQVSIKNTFSTDTHLSICEINNANTAQISASSSSSSTASANSAVSATSADSESTCTSSGIGSSVSSNICKLESCMSTRSSTSTAHTIIPDDLNADGKPINTPPEGTQGDNEMSYTYFEQLAIHNCTVTDKSLETIIKYLSNLKSLDMRCCNDLTELCLWSSLRPSLRRLTILDCINISDESFGAICQLLPNLMELNLQAYHVTDTAMTYFAAQHRQNLHTIRLTQCMDLTNQGIINLAHALPNLQRLSLSGSSKLSDDGLDVVCENMKQLTYLDLSWCNKITNSGLECVACDLYLLNTLILDHCSLISDFGIRHLSSMPSLKNLTLRWCELLTDAALIHILNIPKLNYLSLSGCKRITCDGICSLVRHPKLQIIELTHCTSATASVKSYLLQNITNCILLD